MSSIALFSPSMLQTSKIIDEVSILSMLMFTKIMALTLQSDSDDDLSDTNSICLPLDYLPSKLNQHLMLFQKDGISFGIKKRGRCLIADEMGLGKTLQALSVAYYFRNEWPLLIIVPSSLRYPWIEEIEKWFPDLLPEHIHAIENSSDIANISTASVTIVTYGLLRHPSSKIVQEALQNQSFKVVVADESHNIKNRNAVTTKFLVPLLQQARRKILLTGTPALNRPEELFPQLTSIDPRRFGNWSQYAKRYCDARFQYFGRQRRWVTDGAINLEELQTLLTESVMIRRLKKDVLTQLPAKQRQKISFPLKESDVKRELDKAVDAINKLLNGSRQSAAKVFSSGDLRTLVSSNSDSKAVPTGLYGLLSDLLMKTCSAKLGPVMSYIQMLCENRDLKFIVFAYHRVMLDRVCEQLSDENVTFIRIDGNTPTSDRPHLVKQFQSDQKTRVAVLSIKAAGVGLTLTAASLVVFAELDWTPGILEQCEDRAHRIGQKGTVQVHYLVASGTLDDWVWSALVKKTCFVTTALNGQKQVLRMQKGSNELVERLSSADAYVCPTETFVDVANIFEQKQLRDTGQKTVMDYFTSQADRKDISNSSGFTSTENQSTGTQKSRGDEKSIMEGVCDEITLSSPKSIVVIKSDNEENEADLFLNHLNHEVKSRPGLKSTSRKRVGRPSQHKSSMKRKASNGDFASTEKWSCAQCTFINHPLLKFCEMCSVAKTDCNGRSSGECSVVENISKSDVSCAANLSVEHERYDKSNELVLSPRDVCSSFNSGDNTATETWRSVSFVGDIITSTPCRESRDRVLMPLDTSCNTSFTESTSVSDSPCVENVSVIDDCENFDLCGDWNLVDSDDENSHDKMDLSVHKSSVSVDDNLSGLQAVACADVHYSFQYLCSSHTSRVYLYDKHGRPLHINFSPIDLQMENFDELPEILLHPRHLRLLNRFVREWNSLSTAKRRMIVKSGKLFVSPALAYDELKSVGKKFCQQRYSSKSDVAMSALTKAKEIGGSVRLITRSGTHSGSSREKPMDMSSDADSGLHSKNVSGVVIPTSDLMETLSGFVQAVDASGNPLCLHCQTSFDTTLIDKSTIKQNPWSTRLCSQQCMQQFWVRRHSGYAARQVYEYEHGVCQMCGFDARAFLQRMESMSSTEKRIRLIEESVYKSLNPRVKERMVRQPSQGLFWNIDHILAVSDGGGQCDVDNLRTLCTVCHREVTAQQSKVRAQQRNISSASKCQNITSFFRPMRT